MTDAVENPDKLTSMEVDVIGEVMNISMAQLRQLCPPY